MKFLYLDNDGVLNTLYENPKKPHDSRYIYSTAIKSSLAFLLKKKVALIREFILEYDLKVIVSSTWRYYYKSLTDMVNDYDKMGIPNVHGMVNTNNTMPTRGLEILHNVQCLNLNTDEWVALDDDIEPEDSPNFIRVNGYKGLMKRDINKAKKILSL